MHDLYPSFISLCVKLNHIQNLEAVDAKDRFPKEYTTWREDPSNFNVNGIYPVRKLWGAAREAWREILLSPVNFSLNIVILVFHIVKLISCDMNIYLFFSFLFLFWMNLWTFFLSPAGREFFDCHSQINFEGTDLYSFRATTREVRNWFNRCSHPGGYFC